MRKDRLQAIRVKRGYTQETLAEALGIEKKQVSRWETGSTIPGSEKLGEIAQILGVSADYLLGLTDNPVANVRVDNLTTDEYEVVAAMRRGEKLEAIKIISGR